MTTELEKTFFDTFGIEPKKVTIWNALPCYMSEEYPQISDKQYLELICIANHEDVYIELVGTDVETMKKNLLENFIHFKSIIPRHQVQAIFEGGR